MPRDYTNLTAELKQVFLMISNSKRSDVSKGSNLNPTAHEKSAVGIIGQLLVGGLAFHGADEPGVVLHPGVDVVGVGAVGEDQHAAAAANGRRTL